MILQIEKNEQCFDRAVAMAVCRQVLGKPDSLIGLATGNTTIGLHAWIARLSDELGVDFSRAKTVNLDEYVGISAENPLSCRYRINKQLLDLINIDKQNTYVPNGLTQPIEDELTVFEQTVKAFGGIDLQIVSIGGNGHIAFNEPGTPFGQGLRIATLSASTIGAKSGFFGGEEHVPRYGITMGIRDIMQARRILLVAKGAHKADIMRTTLHGPVTEGVPASVLQLHPALHVIVDEAAAAQL